MHWGLGQGHEAILQRFYDVNLVVLKPTDQDMLLEVHLVAPRTEIMHKASKAVLAALEPWETQ